MNNTSVKLLISGMTTATALVGYMQMDKSTNNDYLIDSIVPPIECCMPADTFQDPYYEIVVRQIKEEIDVNSIGHFHLTGNFETEIDSWFQNQASYSSENIKNRINKLLGALLSSEEIEKARSLLDLTGKYFPDDPAFSLAKKIIAPPKLISSTKSEIDGINETIQFFKTLGKSFDKKWIAVSKGQLLGVSDSYKTLAENFNDKNVFITKVI